MDHVSSKMTSFRCSINSLTICKKIIELNLIKIRTRFDNIGVEVETLFKIFQLESLNRLFELWIVGTDKRSGLLGGTCRTLLLRGRFHRDLEQAIYFFGQYLLLALVLFFCMLIVTVMNRFCGYLTYWFEV